MTRPADRTVDIGELGAALRRRWRWVAGGALGGVVLALLASAVVPPQYRAKASVLLRSGVEGSGLGGRSRQGDGVSLGGLADLLSLGSGLDTELEILTSRAVAGAVVDSLGLQARVARPRATAVAELFSLTRWERVPPPQARYRFERDGDGYRVSGATSPVRAVPGVPVRLDGSEVVLRAGAALPDVFEVEVAARQDAVAALQKRLKVQRLGGEVAELAFRAGDARTAAAVPNATVAQYLARRRTSDRGVNQRRYEFLEEHTDSVRVELARAEAALRAEQERSGVLDPQVYGKAELEQGLALRAEHEALEAEAGAFRTLLRQSQAGGISPRDLAAYPTFLENPAINRILSELTTLDRERTALLDRRTERDPDVVVIDQQVRQLERQLVETSSAYLRGLERKQAELKADLGRFDALLGALPAKAQANFRAQREVMRLSQTLVALETQLVEARLAAIAEGGDVRQVDVAEVPRRPFLPKLWLSLALGIFGGVFFGAVGAVGGGIGARRLQDERQAARIADVPVLRFDAHAPLLLGGATESARSVLVVALGGAGRALAVAERVAATAALRGAAVVLADWHRAHPPAALPPRAGEEAAHEHTHADVVVPEALERAAAPEGGGYLVFRGNGASTPSARAAFAELERRAELVVAALPTLDDPVTVALLSPERAALLVVELERTLRSELEESLRVLDRLGVPVAGVVVCGAGDDGA
jgi:uncharacterized protein involved in exopolysaccharide biosynthesis